MVCETVILICWLEGDVFRIRVQGRCKAFEEENMSHDLLLSSKYYVKRNFKENWILLVRQWVFCAFGNFDCAI